MDGSKRHTNGRLRNPCVLMIGMLCGAAVAANVWSTHPVDDSLSQASAPAAQLRWRDPLPSTRGANMLDATTDVRIVLNVSPWVGRPARIYMRMPSLPQSSLAVQWATGGILIPGHMTSGQRQLVFQGVIAGSRLEDTLRVVASVDARDPLTPTRVNFTFEIEVPSP